MAMKFATCYPVLPQGLRTPCGIFADRQSGIVQEMVCPEIPEAVCRQILSDWNDRVSADWNGRHMEEEFALFVCDELKRL